MLRRTMALKFHRERHLGSLRAPFFFQVCLIGPPIRSIAPIAHSPSTQAPLQPPLQMTITMFVRDVVLKAAPKKLTRSPPRLSVDVDKTHGR